MNKPLIIILTLTSLLFGCDKILKNNNIQNEANLAVTKKLPPTNNTENGLRISYVGNMGVLIENEEKTVLIDGLHKKYKPAYLHPTKIIVEELIQNNYKGFTNIEVNMVSHKHKDHFSPELTLEFLNSNQNSITIGSDQIKREIEEIESFNNGLLDRIEVINFDYGIYEIIHQGIKVKAIRCDHTYQAKHKNIKNIAYLIDINGYTILHVGDTDWEVSKKTFDKLKVSELNIDIAILPYWMLMGQASKLKIEKLINPKKIIATHIGPVNTNQTTEDIKKNLPNVICLTELNEVIHYER